MSAWRANSAFPRPADCATEGQHREDAALTKTTSAFPSPLPPQGGISRSGSSYELIKSMIDKYSLWQSALADICNAVRACQL